MTWWLLFLVVVLAALVAVREGFAATSTIKNPASWDAAELTRIRGLVTPPSTLSDAEIREVVGGFWSYSVPSALSNEPATEKGWSVATSAIPIADITEYMDGVIQTTPAYAEKRRAFTDLLTAYYITQGQSVFQAARGYPTDTPASPPTPEPTAPTTIERPTSATQSLRSEIATTAGVPTTDSAAIDVFVQQVQRFYDTVYLPDKTPPTYDQIMGFVDGVEMTSIPPRIGNNFKAHLLEILQTFFTPATGLGVSPLSGAGRLAGAADLATGGAEEGTWVGTGRNIQGPASGGRGSAAIENTTGGLAIPRNYPVLYGGMQDYSSALPSSASLGSDPTARFLPYSRVPGDQDLYPDPYRLGKYFSTSSYSKSAGPDPAPFLADFSKFFT